MKFKERGDYLQNATIQAKDPRWPLVWASTVEQIIYYFGNHLYLWNAIFPYRVNYRMAFISWSLTNKSFHSYLSLSTKAPTNLHMLMIPDSVCGISYSVLLLWKTFLVSMTQHCSFGRGIFLMSSPTNMVILQASGPIKSYNFDCTQATLICY